MVYTEKVNTALRLIYEAHDGQLDKSGVPYIYHPVHIAEQMKDEESVLVALLHDVLEDTSVTSDKIRELFGDRVCEAVEVLTRRDGEDYFDYIGRVCECELARRVKLCDLEHNLDSSRLVGADKDAASERAEVYTRARRMLLDASERMYADGRQDLAGHQSAHPIKHFRTITKHRHKVMAHCFKVGVGFQGLFHDMSKYSPTEFCEGAKNYLGTRSPNEHAREVFGYSRAWLHHKGRNKHHFEYWRDVDVRTKQYAPVKMPVRYVAEMFCDRVAASKIYQGDRYTDRSALDYFLRGGAKKKMHPETAALLESWLIMLAERGEAETFAHIKQMYKSYRREEKRRS